MKIKFDEVLPAENQNPKEDLREHLIQYCTRNPTRKAEADIEDLNLTPSHVWIDHKFS